MRTLHRILCATGMACTFAATSQARQAPVADGIAAPQVNPNQALPGKNDVFRPWSERMNLALRNIPASIIPGFDVTPLLQEDAQNYANGDRTLRTGIVLPVNLTERQGQWHDDGAGGKLWILDVGSASALGLRVHFVRMNLPEHATLSAQSTIDPALVSGPFDGRGDLDLGEAWTASLRGPSARIEYHLPAAALEALKAAGGDINNPGVPFEVAEIVHMYVVPGLNSERGETEPCHVDINCVAAWNDPKFSTGRINYVKSGGNFICTGELLTNLSGDLTPYYMTANHCFNTQASATSAEIVWNWWKNGCNGANPDYFTRPRSRVATHLSSGAASDYTFIMVDGALASGRFWMGWDANNIPNNSIGAGVHHPGGGVLRYSSGIANYSLVCSSGSHFRTNFFTAPTEPGSSGSGWYDSSLRFRGQLHCGFSFCGAALDDGDDWGHYAVTYPNISGLMAGGSDDSSEPNDSCAGARAIGTGLLSNRIVKSTNADWYSINVGAGQRIQVTITFEHDYGDVDAELVSTCGGSALDSSTSTTDTETLQWDNYGGATTVRIHPYLYGGGSYADTRANYAINVQLLDAPPQNDLCANARVITSIPYSNTEDSSNAASDGPPGTCNSSGATTLDNSIWYRWTAPENCTATWSISGTYDLIAVVFSGTCGTLSQVGCGDISGGATTETVTFNAVAGTTYYLAAGDWGTSDGGGSTTVSLTTRVDNDACAGARLIGSVPYTAIQDTSLAQADGPAAACDGCGTSVMQNDVWYRWTAPEDCIATVRLTEIDSYDMVMNVWRGSCGALTNIGCDDEPEPFVRTFNAQGGLTYYFQFGDYCITPGGGRTTFNLTCRTLNDECSGAQLLACNSYVEADLNLATSNVTDPVFTCRVFGASRGTNTAWYRFVAASSSVKLYTGLVSGGAADDTLLAVYAGNCSGLSQIACDDDSGDGLLSSVSLGGLTPGATYYVQLAAWSPGDVGVYSITIECPPDCATCPPGSVAEIEPCNENTNGGCNLFPPAYESIECGATVCGNAYYVDGTRDTDWYTFSIEQASTVSWCVTAQMEAQLFILNGDYCDNPALLFGADGVPCQETCVSVALPPGNYIAFVAPEFFGSSFPCGTLGDYHGTLTVDPLCPGDFDGSGAVNTGDLILLLLRFGQTISTCSRLDSNNDGVINTTDLINFLILFGRTCDTATFTAPAPHDPSIGTWAVMPDSQLQPAGGDR